ncbi:hypothetical protein BU23DRAFT_550926 [Bimuria novae-zelandiae CBS 107.79]|uniref:Ankyrin n=1 Tax=Bimuria novae-zelandiae CBS 107.79 TaxID=1447943 RepID=A0A6A5VPZ5_9PLEO|nr:hypothetical protein BU23DRAFT_550926 [Bimuria novae-zelandiae CBS 107.79]
MPLMEARQAILAASSSGDIPALEALLHEASIGINHPRTIYELDSSLSESQQLPTVVQIFEAAITGRQVNVISFLSTKFPNTSLSGPPTRAAIDSGNAEVLKVVCQCDLAAADSELGDDESINALGYAASKKNGAELVRVLLDAGADPNKEPPFKLPACRNVSAAVLGSLPASTFEQFFDAGYQGNDPYAIKFAVEKQRQDILEVLFARSRNAPDAQYPPKGELVELAEKNNDSDMIAAIKRLYAARSEGKKGLISSFVSRFRLKG